MPKVFKVSTVAALTKEGIVAAFCYTGTMTGELFRFFIENFLVPILTPKKVVVLDNASTHYDEQAIAFVETTGAGIIFLPPYCPELNPIEFIWAKVNIFIKKAVIFNTSGTFSSYC
jgi:transposase